MRKQILSIPGHTWAPQNIACCILGLVWCFGTTTAANSCVSCCTAAAQGCGRSTTMLRASCSAATRLVGGKGSTLFGCSHREAGLQRKWVRFPSLVWLEDAKSKGFCGHIDSKGCLTGLFCGTFWFGGSSLVQKAFGA